jgi:hypothetical protein
MGEVIDDLPQMLKDVELLFNRFGQPLVEIVRFGSFSGRDLQKRFHDNYFNKFADEPQRYPSRGDLYFWAGCAKKKYPKNIDAGEENENEDKWNDRDVVSSDPGRRGRSPDDPLASVDLPASPADGRDHRRGLGRNRL